MFYNAHSATAPWCGHIAPVNIETLYTAYSATAPWCGHIASVNIEMFYAAYSATAPWCGHIASVNIKMFYNAHSATAPWCSHIASVNIELFYTAQCLTVPVLNICFTGINPLAVISCCLCLPTPRQPGKGLPGEKADMGIIVFVIPVRECITSGREGRHKCEIAARPQQGPEQIQLQQWMIQVFYHFGGGDKIILVLEHIRIICIDRIVDRHPVASFFQHQRKRRSRSGTKIQTAASGCQTLSQRP